MIELDCVGKTLDLSEPRVMGVLNVTPDSFSDGGRFLAPGRAIERALQMVEEGAAIIDIGGESTRPGSVAVSDREEMERVVPVIEALAGEIPVPISIDTSKPDVMVAAVKAGAGLINDVYALRRPGALEAAAQLEVPVCLMHMQGEPRTMQMAPSYVDVVGEVKAFLAERVSACQSAGIRRERLLVDPGFGFGKGLEHNLALLRHLDVIDELGLPVLVGLSRKSMIGALVGAPLGERVSGSVAAAALAVFQGARLVRAHDVKATCDAVRVAAALRAVA